MGNLSVDSTKIEKMQKFADSKIFQDLELKAKLASESKMKMA